MRKQKINKAETIEIKFRIARMICDTHEHAEIGIYLNPNLLGDGTGGYKVSSYEHHIQPCDEAFNAADKILNIFTKEVCKEGY
jgi:hypothetical protein